MPIFISYSHQDREFVDQLAMQLVQHGASVWLDRWELDIGDSLLDRIQRAVRGASALIVVMSPHSVASEWCRRELNAGLMRELDERRVIVLPLLLEDCEVPVFLREKLYADFRQDYDAGLAALRQSLAHIVNPNMGRIEEHEYHVDWAFDWGQAPGGLYGCRLTAVEQAIDHPYCCLTVVSITADRAATNRYSALVQEIGDSFARLYILRQLGLCVRDNPQFQLRLSDQREQLVEARWPDSERHGEFEIFVSVRWLGQDTGRDILVNVGAQIQSMVRGMEDVLRRGGTET